MADYSDPKRAVAYRLTLSLYARADNQIKVTPTLAAGDFKISKDNGATANLATLPVETPASSGILQVDFSATEMTADLVTLVCRDAAGAEWNDVTVNIATLVRQMADLAYPATSGRSMVVDASGLVDANTVKVGPTGSGTAQTARDIGLSVLLSAGTGTGQLDFTSGVVKANATQWLGGTIPAVNVTGVPKVDVFDWLGTGAPANTGDAFARLGAPAGASVSADVAAVKGVLPAALVSGRIDASVGAMAANVLTATAIAADAITDAKVAADVTIASVTGAVGSVTGAVGSVTGLTAANLDVAVSTRLATAGYTAPDNTSITAIKTKTDSLTFTVAGQVDSNVQYVNDVQVTGNGQSGTEWGPA